MKTRPIRRVSSVSYGISRTLPRRWAEPVPRDSSGYRWVVEQTRPGRSASRWNQRGQIRRRVSFPTTDEGNERINFIGTQQTAIYISEWRHAKVGLFLRDNISYCSIVAGFQILR